MTAPKKPTGAPRWAAPPHALSPKAKAALIDALAYPADSQDPQLLKCLQRVEYCLGFYPGGVAAIDNGPSTSVYVGELKALKNACLKLTALLAGGINPFTRETLSAHFLEPASMTEPDAIEKADDAILSLALACNSALKKLEQEPKSGRGRRPAGARKDVLTTLLELYGDYSKRPYEKRVRKGASDPLSDFEKYELKFARSAFGDIKADPFQGERGDQQWIELIAPIKESSAKLRARKAQAIDPRTPKKAKQAP